MCISGVVLGPANQARAVKTVQQNVERALVSSLTAKMSSATVRLLPEGSQGLEHAPRGRPKGAVANERPDDARAAATTAPAVLCRAMIYTRRQRITCRQKNRLCLSHCIRSLSHTQPRQCTRNSRLASDQSTHASPRCSNIFVSPRGPRVIMRSSATTVRQISTWHPRSIICPVCATAHLNCPEPPLTVANLAGSSKRPELALVVEQGVPMSTRSP